MSAQARPNVLSPRWSKVLTDLWSDKTRTSLVVASIAVGVFAIGMIMTAYLILSADIKRSYAAANPPNVIIQTDPFDDDLVDAVAKLPGVQDAQGRLLVKIRARRGSEDWVDLTGMAISDFPGPINHLKSIEGALTLEKGTALVSQDALHVTGFRAGDTLEIQFPDGSEHTLTVAGLVADQTTAKPDPYVSNYALVTLKTLRSYGQDESYNNLYVTVQGDANDTGVIAGVAAAVKDQLERSGRTVYRSEEHTSDEHPMGDTALAILGMLGALGGLITILSSSLIINTLNALLTQQLRQIGVMKLVGGRSLQILGMYVALIIAYSLIALALALPLGAIAGYGMAYFIAQMIGAVLQGFRILPIVIVVQVLIAILIPLGAGFLPVRNGARVSILQAISSNRPNRQGGRGGFLNGNLGWFRWISRPILLSFRNTFRKKGRLMLTIFTLTVAGAVFIAVFNVHDSLSSMVDQLLQHFMGDVTVELRYPDRVSKVEQTLLQIPGIQRVEGWTAAGGEIWDAQDAVVSNLSIVAPPQDTQLLNLKLQAGRWLLPHEERALVVSDTIYGLYPDLNVGDRLRIKLPDQRVEEWTVVGIFPFLGLFGDPLGYANFEFIAQQNHLPNQAASYRIVTDVHGAAGQEALTTRIDRALTDLKIPVQSIQSGYLMRQKAAMGLNVLIIFLLLMAILTAFVGSIGLTGAMSINVLERTREIGVMRTIGAVDMVIMRSVIVEALVIGMITWALAIGISIPISSLLLDIIGEAVSDSPMALSFTPLGILLWLAVVILLSVFASIVPARKAARLTINEVLAYE
jgi:putative ABC transport system permease protein